MAALEQLNISENDMNCHGVEGLVCHIAKVTTLQTLDLKQNSIGSQGARVLAHCVKVLPVLQYIDIRASTVASSEEVDRCQLVSLKLITSD